MELIGTFIASLLLIFPCWKIYKKAGLYPPLSLLIFLPLGLLIVMIVLAFAEWPNIESKEAN